MDDTRNIDWRRFGASILAPPAPRRDEFMRHAAQIRGGVLAGLFGAGENPSESEAEEALISEIVLASMWEDMVARSDNPGWWDRSERSFVPFLEVFQEQYNDARMPRRGWTPVGISRTPRNLATMVEMLGADPGNLVAAEELALEACYRLTPWGLPRIDRVAWTVLRPAWSEMWTDVFRWPSLAAYVSASDADQAAVRDRGDDVRDAMREGAGIRRSLRGDRLPDRLILLAGSSGVAQRLWRRLAAKGAVVSTEPDSFFSPSRTRGEKFSDLPDALEPYLMAVGRGYFPIDVRGDVLLMGALARSFDADAMARLRRASERRWGSSL